MAYEMKAGQGNLWRNKKKTDERHPNSTGRGICPCCKHTFYISGWTKEARNGEKWVSLAFKPVDEAAQVDTTTGQPQTTDPGF
jgi:hypothetical protein